MTEDASLALRRCRVLPLRFRYVGGLTTCSAVWFVRLGSAREGMTDGVTEGQTTPTDVVLLEEGSAWTHC